MDKFINKCLCIHLEKYAARNNERNWRLRCEGSETISLITFLYVWHQGDSTESKLLSEKHECFEADRYNLANASTNARTFAGNDDDVACSWCLIS